uniref:Uncharacterized protein n=1 Tax=Chelydra serpentina TaxID=8475 RepID=A0A8C3RYN4_CHESE
IGNSLVFKRALAVHILLHEFPSKIYSGIQVRILLTHNFPQASSTCPRPEKTKGGCWLDSTAGVALV